MDFELFKLGLSLESESEGADSVLHQSMGKACYILITCGSNKCLPSLFLRRFLGSSSFFLALGLLDLVGAQGALVLLQDDHVDWCASQELASE